MFIFQFFMYSLHAQHVTALTCTFYYADH